MFIGEQLDILQELSKGDVNKRYFKKMNVIFSNHALFEIKRRQIDKKIIDNIFKNPHQKILSKKERIIVQGKYYNQHQNKEMLLRIIGKEVKNTFYVITVYETSKINKYWTKEG